MDGKVIEIYKNMGETPLEALDRLRIEEPEYKDVALSYAGRLDPLAEGVMLILVGEANKEREKYLGLDKEYECEMLLGVGTDTYDALGIVRQITNNKEQITIDWQKYTGKFSQEYPPYSSKTVGGKPLFEYAREGKLDEIEMPTKDVEIYSLEQTGEKEISIEEILKEIETLTHLVKGDFRQKEILESWQENLEKCKDLKIEKLQIISFKISCSSGTYIRSLVERMGKDIGVPACVLRLKRTRVGSIDKTGKI